MGLAAWIKMDDDDKFRAGMYVWCDIKYINDSEK